MTAAGTRRSRHRSESRPIRWSMTARTPGGIRRWASGSAIWPSASSRRTASATKSGFPSVSEWTASTSRGDRLNSRSTARCTPPRHPGSSPLERDLGRVPLSHQLGQRRGQRISHRRVDVAERTDHEQPSCRRSRERRTEAGAARARPRHAGRRARARADAPALALRRNELTASKSRKRAPSDSQPRRSREDRGTARRSSGRSWARSAAPAPSCARSASGSASRT